MPSQNFRVKNGLEVGTGVTISASGIINATSIVVSGNSASTFPQLIVSGVATFQNSVYLGDNDFIYLGDSSDLYIGHNGSVSAIADAGTGDLYIAGDNSLIITDLSYAENKAKFNTNSSVELYYDNSKKFETLGAGVTVTGTTFTNQLNVSGVTTASSFIKSGGTSSQFLKADGSVDSSTYATSVTLNQTSYSGTNPITTSGTTINIASTSNAYGTRTVSTSDPTGGNDGDIWYKY